MPLEKVKQELLSKEKTFISLDKHDYDIFKPKKIIISEEKDTVKGITRGYGKDNKAQRPQDYLEEFQDFIKDNEN